MAELGFKPAIISNQDRGLGTLMVPPNQGGGRVYTETLSEGYNSITQVTGQRREWGQRTEAQ